MKPRPPLFRSPTFWAFAAVGLLVAAALGYWHPAGFAAGYRYALFVALAPAVGSTLFTLIHRSTGGEWGMVLARYLAPGVHLLPWIWLAGLPLIFVPGGFHLEASGYESRAGVLARAGILAVIWFVLRALLESTPPARLSARDNARSWLGPVGLIVSVFGLTFVADDWIEGPHPGWHSTAFPIVWMTAQCMASLALAVFLGTGADVEPGKEGLSRRPIGNDLGNLLLANLIFWTYVSYGEFIIVWSGNKPDEISWFLTREQSGWFYVIPLLFLGNFVVPFLCLLSRRFKKSRIGLRRLALAILVGQLVYIAWLILPESRDQRVPALGLDLFLALAALGMVGSGYRQWMEAAPQTA